MMLQFSHNFVDIVNVDSSENADIGRRSSVVGGRDWDDHDRGALVAVIETGRRDDPHQKTSSFHRFFER